ncbi:divisome protein SepX/GlpR [Actinomadura fibrosa]|uniref:Uncharacterized protein n=1 Tax=Actinomadura fibrosa TaxID=111802 RepID=A0ABW2Y328_9ACTN
MSSAVLYLAIVAVWAIVLVPMWLRRDNEAGLARLLHKRTDEDEAHPEQDQDQAADQDTGQPRRRAGRAAVIARRRRRTAGLSLLVLTAVAIVTAGVAPWWITLPPAALLTGHLALLRVAVGMDAARDRAAAEAARAAAARARAKALEARRAGQTAAPAEIIELPAPEEVFDQYADDRRAVGE